MLAESVVQAFGGRVRFLVQNFGDSVLARRFGVTRYPAFFVDDILVATPKDFGFFGKGEGPDVARYAPFRSAEAHARFRADLERAVQLVLAGNKLAAAQAAPAVTEAGIRTLPEFEVTDLAGEVWRRADCVGRPVLVEFWATWCPPCRSTLQWLAEQQRAHGERLIVLTLAVDSDDNVVRELARATGSGIHWAMATAEVARAFGDVSALPTLFLFDPTGATSAVFYGAPPGLHDTVAAALRKLLP